MNLKLTLLTLPLIASVGFAQEQRNVSTFNGLKASGAFDIEIKAGNKDQVTITGDSSNFKNVLTEVKDGILVLSSEGNIRDDLKVVVYKSSLNKILLSGASDVHSTDTITTNEIDLV